MFKFDRLYGNGKVYDVEYFEVGKRQFREFCSHDDNIVLSMGPRVRRNDYIVISAWSSFGNQPSYVDYEHVFRSLNRAIDFVHNMQDSNLYCCQMRSDLNHGRHFEIWHICDDYELWGDWQNAVADSNIVESEAACDVCCCDASGCASKVVKVSQSARYYYAAIHKYGVDFTNDVIALVRFPSRQQRDKYVYAEHWEGRKRESVTRDIARGYASSAFSDTGSVVVVDCETGADDMIYYYATRLHAHGYDAWVRLPDGSQCFVCL